ncbi:MAG TPA: two-component system sensor histidine kinase/response regulator, partial [Aggregicoccus sp.]|nr:two-component system sensor histidine kinase/response regulator [Aggregicoccus sp.]
MTASAARLQDFPLPLPPSSDAAALLAAVDWAKTPLGPVQQWPHALRTAVVMALGSRFPMGLLWGEHYVQLYNDAYVPILGRKHPASMGQSARDCWPELWDSVGVMFEGVRRTGQAVWFEDLRMDIDRGSGPQEGYFTFSYSPILGEGHRVDGLFVSALETTEHVLGARRQRSLRRMAEAAIDARSVDELLRRCMAPLADNPEDLPSAAVYFREAGEAQARRVAGHGALAQEALPPLLDLGEGSALAAALRAELPSPLPIPLRPGAPEQGSAGWRVLPLLRSGRERPAGLLVLAPGPVRPLDEPYQHYLVQVAEQLGSA